MWSDNVKFCLFLFVELTDNANFAEADTDNNGHVTAAGKSNIVQ